MITPIDRSVSRGTPWVYKSSLLDHQYPVRQGEHLRHIMGDINNRYCKFVPYPTAREGKFFLL